MKPQAGESTVLESRDRGLIEPGQALELGLTQAEGQASVENPTAEPRERRPDCRIKGFVVADVTPPLRSASRRTSVWRGHGRNSAHGHAPALHSHSSRTYLARPPGAPAQDRPDAATGNPRDPRSRGRPRRPDAATGNPSDPRSRGRPRRPDAATGNPRDPRSRGRPRGPVRLPETGALVDPDGARDAFARTGTAATMSR